MHSLFHTLLSEMRLTATDCNFFNGKVIFPLCFKVNASCISVSFVAKEWESQSYLYMTRLPIERAFFWGAAVLSGVKWSWVTASNKQKCILNFQVFLSLVIQGSRGQMLFTQKCKKKTYTVVHINTMLLIRCLQKGACHWELLHF